MYVPDKDLGKVSDALFGAGAGVIGKYTECSFRLHGKGTFFGACRCESMKCVRPSALSNS